MNEGIRTHTHIAHNTQCTRTHAPSVSDRADAKTPGMPRRLGAPGDEVHRYVVGQSVVNRIDPRAHDQSAVVRDVDSERLDLRKESR
jgi:hypothetical protein